MLMVVFLSPSLSFCEYYVVSVGIASFQPSVGVCRSHSPGPRLCVDISRQAFRASAAPCDSPPHCSAPPLSDGQASFCRSATRSNPPLALLLRVSRLSGPYVVESEGGETLHSSASQPVHFIHPGEALACPIRQHYNGVIVINELPSSGCRGPRAPDRQVVFTARSLDLAVPLILDQLLSVFPARANLFRTNGPVVFQCTHSRAATTQYQHINAQEQTITLYVMPVLFWGLLQIVK